MEKLKLVLFSIITLSLIGFIGYWSLNTIQSGTEYKMNETIAQFEKENKDLKNEVKKLTNELSALQSNLEEPVSNVEKKPEQPVSAPNKNQDLIGELQKLVSDNILLKQKSSGTRVGTVQKFLNIYNKTSNKVDNDYGVDTLNAVKAFQKDQGLLANGEAGAGTFNKMIDWLKKYI